MKDSKSREVECFTTPSGVQAVIATSIPPEALDKFAKGLARKIADRKKRGEDRAAGQKPEAVAKK